MDKIRNSPFSYGFKSNPFPSDNSCSPKGSQVVSNNTPGSTMIPQESSEMGNISVMGAFLVLCITYFVRRQLKHQGHKGNNIIANLPGPKPLPIVGNGHELWAQDERLNILLKWSIQYRPCYTFRLGPRPVVMLNSVEYIQKLLSSSDNGHLVKGPLYEIFRPVWRDGMIISSPEKWRHRRKIISRAFTHNSLNGYMYSFNKHSEQLVSNLKEIFEEDNGGTGKPINWVLWQHSFRIICETTLGVEAKEIANELEIIEILEVCKTIGMNRALKPWLLSNYLWYFHPDKENLKKGSEALGEFAQKVIDRHRSVSRVTETSSGPESENNIVPGMKKQFVSLLDEGVAAGLDDEGLLEEIMTIIIAGYETTAITMQFLLMLLATHQEDQDKCRLEVDEVFENASLSPGGKFTLEGAANMKYLHKCVEETMRLYPILFVFFRKLRAPLKLDENLELPEDTDVGIFLPGIHRNPEYFPNPDAFIPDRFSEENCNGRSPYAFLPFSMGPRNCLGFKFGLVEMKTTVAWILRHFVVTSNEKLEDVRILSDIGLTPERGYNFSLTRRIL